VPDAARPTTMAIATMRPALFATVLASVLVAALTSHSVCAAGPIAPEAKVVLDEGLALYEARSYAQALAAFRRGYALDPHPDFLYAMAQAERLSGDCRAASEDYRRFLKADPPAHEASLARENLAKCDAITSAEPVLVPPPPPVVPAPPVVATAPAAAPTKPDAADDGPTFWAHPASITLVTIALASASAGAVLMSLGEVRAQEAEGAPDLAAFTADIAAARDFRIAGGTLLGAGALSACISAIHWGVLSASGGPAKPPAAAATVTTLVGPRGGFVALELAL